MDKKKRDLLKLGAAGALGAALAGQSASKAHGSLVGNNEVSNKPSSERLKHLFDQTQLVSEAAATMKGRAEFLADPMSYAQERGVTLDPGLETVIYNELRSIESSFILQGGINPYLDDQERLDVGIKGREIDGVSSQLVAAPVVVATAASTTTTTTAAAAASSSVVAVAAVVAVVAAAAAVVNAAVSVYTALSHTKPGKPGPGNPG